jgi:hypothetical protein
MPGQYLYLSHYRILLDPFQFIIQPSIPYYKGCPRRKRQYSGRSQYLSFQAKKMYICTRVLFRTVFEIELFHCTVPKLNFLFSISFIPVLGHIQPPIPWVPRAFTPRGEDGRGVKLATHLKIVRSSRRSGFIHPLPYTRSQRIALLVKHRDFPFYITFCKWRSITNRIHARIAVNVGTTLT